MIGHGGAGYSATNPYAPNSGPSIQRALAHYDTDGVEIDVQFTADGRLIAFHDEFLEAKTDCAGRVDGKTLRELGICRYRNHLWAVTDDRILTLDEAIDTALRAKPSAHLFLDLKTFTAQAAGRPIETAYVEGLGKVTDAVSKDRLWLVSGSERVLYSLKLFLGDSAHVLADAYGGARGIYLSESLGLEGMVVSQKKVTRSQVEHMHRQGRLVVLFGVKSYPAARDALALKPEIVQADDIPALQSALR